MNEEHLEMPMPGESPAEFEVSRGEQQRRGARDPQGAPPPLPPNIPVGVAPPDPLVVVSNFDTRPIGAYDFANTQTALMNNGEDSAPAEVSFDVPDGYTAVLRLVRLQWTPPGVMNIDASDDETLTISLLRDGTAIPNNSVTFYGDLTEYEWPTHQVFGFYESMGLRLVSTGFVVPGEPEESIRVAVTFMGTLIPSKSRPPAVEIASDPVLVREYTPGSATGPAR